jgi:hypothetical protein
MRKFEVTPSVTRSRTYAPYRRFARNPNAFPVASSVRLTFNLGWLPDHDFAPHLYPASGRDMLNILSGWRAGDLNAFL